MIDHILFNVRDYAKSKKFYLAALKPLGYAVIMEASDKAGALGPGKPEIWLREGAPSAPLHLSLGAVDRATVDGFHAAALAAGAKDNGRPGLRTQYHPNYYAAYVLDPDGNNLEAVCRAPA